MSFGYAVLSLLVLAGASIPARAEEPLACKINALAGPQRDRYQLLSEKLRRTVVERVELPNGYKLVLDLGRLPRDSAGSPFCVVEVAEWVDLEARCCPFLDFGIEVSGKGGPVKLRLTGGKDVKAFLEKELGLFRPAA